MSNVDRDRVCKAFAAYTSNYDITSPKIRLKVDHTYRVATISEIVAKTVKGVDAELAWLLGMLHDVGRFEQIKRYNTFVDSKSVDHAGFGADLLFNESLLDLFGEFDDDERAIIETAIRNHSKFRIDEDIKKDVASYCHILRDADKIDILRVNCETPIEEIYDVSTKELKESAVSESVKRAFDERHAVLRSMKSTPADNLVGHICLIFELVYKKSKELVKEQGFADRLLGFESDNPDTANWFEYMKDNIWKDF